MSNVVKLKNGMMEPLGIVVATMESLSTVGADNPVALYELVSACRDRAHAMFGNTGELLVEYALIQQVRSDGTAVVHDSIRNIVNAAVIGDGLDISLTNPAMEEVNNG